MLYEQGKEELGEGSGGDILVNDIGFLDICLANERENMGGVTGSEGGLQRGLELYPSPEDILLAVCFDEHLSL